VIRPDVVHFIMITWEQTQDEFKTANACSLQYVLISNQSSPISFSKTKHRFKRDLASHGCILLGTYSHFSPRMLYMAL